MIYNCAVLQLLVNTYWTCKHRPPFLRIEFTIPFSGTFPFVNFNLVFTVSSEKNRRLQLGVQGIKSARGPQAYLASELGYIAQCCLLCGIAVRCILLRGRLWLSHHYLQSYETQNSQFYKVSSESCPFDLLEEHCGGIFQWPMNTPSCMDNSLR